MVIFRNISGFWICSKSLLNFHFNFKNLNLYFLRFSRYTG